ncbi:MAG: SemiSWEET transporter [Chloroflexota bacterium]|nr:SemiSWEET transporter [Chloroflexota bacterium]
MEYAAFIGSLAGILTTISFVPQVIKTWRSKSAEDISSVMMIILASGVFLWFVYGVYKNDIPIIAANLVTFLLTSSILGLKLRYR